MNINIDSYYQTRETFFSKIQSTTNTKKVAMAFLMACFTGLLAQLILPLPWTPVPVTGQTMGALASGLFLGKRFGALSQIIYLFGGVLEISWFGGMTSGIGVVLGPTGGYLIGLILTAFFVGHFAEKYTHSRKFKKMSGLLLIANFGVIYIPGLIGLGVWMYFTQGTFPDIVTLLVLGFIPFIIGDLFKIAGLATISKVFLPK